MRRDERRQVYVASRVTSRLCELVRALDRSSTNRSVSSSSEDPRTYYVCTADTMLAFSLFSSSDWRHMRTYIHTYVCDLFMWMVTEKSTKLRARGRNEEVDGGKNERQTEPIPMPTSDVRTRRTCATRDETKKNRNFYCFDNSVDDRSARMETCI